MAGAAVVAVTTAAPAQETQWRLPQVDLAEVYPRQGPAAGASAARVHLGPVDLQGSVGARLAYDDNIYLGTSGGGLGGGQGIPEEFKDKADTVYSIVPAIQALYRDLFDLSARYWLSIDRYASESDADHEDQDASLRVGKRWETNAGLDLELANALAYSDRFRVLVGDEVASDYQVLSNATTARAYYQTTMRTGLGADYAHLISDPSSDQYIGSVEDRFGLTGYRLLTPTKSLFLGGHYGLLDLDDGSTGDFIGGNAGIRGELTQKVSGNAQVGYDERNYDEDQGEAQRGDQSTLTTAVALTYLPWDRTSVTLGLNRSLQASVVTAGQNYTRTALTLGVRHRFPRDYDLTLTVGQGRNEYDDPYRVALPEGGYTEIDRTDDTFSFGAALGYPFRDWLRGSVFYDFLDRSSDLETADYSRNVVGVMLTWLW